MKKIGSLLAVAVLWAIFPGSARADFMLGLNPASLYSISKEARGIYRTPVSSRNVDIIYKETIFYYGFGAIFEAGFNEGHAGLRLLPTMYKGSTTVDSSAYSSSVFDYLGFTNEQSAKLVGKAKSVKITESGIGTGILFKYNFPTQFKADGNAMQWIQKIVATMNPWFGLGPMQITFSRTIEAEGLEEFASQSYTDFYVLIGGGMNLEFNTLWKAYPRNVIISLDVLFSTNLTPDNSGSTNDDNLNISQGGFMINIGAGYRL